MKQERWSAPHQPWLLRLRRSLARSRSGVVLRLAVHGMRRSASCLPELRHAGVAPRAPTRPSPRANVLLVSHCDFTGNSGLHVYAIATELRRRGFAPTVAVPAYPETVRDVGEPTFPVLSYREVRRGLRFDDGAGPDLVHAFTPREHVRRLTMAVVRASGAPYAVHLEDNEEAVRSGQTDFTRARTFLAASCAVTALMDTLLEFKPEDVPGLVVWPGFDRAILSPRQPREETRAALGLAAETLAVLYTGNVHRSNLEEMRDLYEAVGLLRAQGIPAVLVKTGWNFVPDGRLPRLGDALRDLGWVTRSSVPDLLGAADVLVQPGRPNPFNDYRFPSKLPEFLASGRPVVLPRTNIGRWLDDRLEAMLLDGGGADEIAATVAALAADAELRRRIGDGGRAFALRELTWERSVERLAGLYRDVLGLVPAT